ncbi:MAG: type II secretion system protein GspH [Gammaproteobacteria bacterium CG_4_10_14_0_8_um_filter_38_16]|nr:MAG: type II secretion system protein GspH [Gammaproteobacteria bacterium CG_4_10_14_0_8_um_filter_38_16]PJA03842.1 MAG: type II secretion system protein GspH [Gammaproteobacteria bacterium CG_4_10_14_0_2_um_filter_38_22]PJB10816.1 MAG: type II secretion system protein GspH [Gammaproteobacteria bacterium CG_4_9_14_3_um_filter_38_9]
MRTNSVKTRFVASRLSSAFTLIEVLVVLIIVAIITAVAVLAFGHFGRGRREKIIVNQFIHVITLAQQQAILTPMVLGLGVSADGYQFYEYAPSTHSSSARWLLLSSATLSHPTAFRYVFQVNMKLISAYSLKLKNDSAKPAILFLPSGYVTPFTVKLSGASSHFLIDVKNNGVVSLDESKKQ